MQKEQLKAEDHERFKNEILALRKLDHPNIIKMYEAFED